MKCLTGTVRRAVARGAKDSREVLRRGRAINDRGRGAARDVTAIRCYLKHRTDDGKKGNHQ